jgi:predicted nucleotidyltransferase
VKTVLTHEDISNAIVNIALLHNIKKVSYFGSYADGKATKESDLDLLVEFHKPSVSLFILSAIKIELEDLLNINVDVIHATIPKNSLIEPRNVVQVYG